MYYMVGCYITYTRRTAVLSAITFITGILNVVLSYYLIISNGFVGAAQGTVIAYLISFAMTWYLAAREYPMPWFSFFERKKAVS
jgi:Na+-driven multidrug efflux pump